MPGDIVILVNGQNFFEAMNPETSSSPVSFTLNQQENTTSLLHQRLADDNWCPVLSMLTTYPALPTARNLPLTEPIWDWDKTSSDSMLLSTQ